MYRLCRVFLCKSKRKKERKLYLLLFTCSLSRAIHLGVLPNQATQEFTHALKRLIARRRRPNVSAQITHRSYTEQPNFDACGRGHSNASIDAKYITVWTTTVTTRKGSR